MLINGRHVQFIAEVKPVTPGEGAREKSWEDVFAIADTYGDMLSVHTNPIWGGSFDLLCIARKMTKKPILAKGIHLHDREIQQALAIGADAVLVVGRIPHQDLLPFCYVEALTARGFAEIPDEAAMRVWNARDLIAKLVQIGKNDVVNQLLAVSRERNSELQPHPRPTFHDVASFVGGAKCQASHVRTVADVDPLADAIIVGSYLEEFISSLSLAR